MTEAAQLGGMSVQTVRCVRREGKERDTAWMPAVGALKMRESRLNKANMRFESSRAKTVPSARTEAERPEGALRLVGLGAWVCFGSHFKL